MNIKWDITYKCNLHCAHCVNGNYLGKIKGELNIEEIEKILGELKGKVKYIHLLGGEPFAREDFLEITKILERNGINFGVNTNGLKLYSKELRENLVKNMMLKNLVFSIEGPNAEINDSIRGKNVFHHIVPNMREVINLKRESERNDLIITVNTVLSKRNIKYIKDMIYFCVDCGVNEFNLLQLIPEGNAKDGTECISLEEELEIIRLVADLYPDVKDKLKIIPRFTTPLARIYAKEVLAKEFPKVKLACGAGCEFFYIDNKGILYPCDRMKEYVDKEEKYSLKMNQFDNLIENEAFNKAFEITEKIAKENPPYPCEQCPLYYKDCIPCPAIIKKKKDEGKGITIKNCTYFINAIKEGNNEI